MPDQNQTPEPREWVSTTCTLADGRRVQVEGHIVPLASSSLPDSGERYVADDVPLLGPVVIGTIDDNEGGVVARCESDEMAQRIAGALNSALPHGGERERVRRALADRLYNGRTISTTFEEAEGFADELLALLDTYRPSSDGGERDALAARIAELERLREQDAERADVAWRTMRGERDAALRERDQAQARSAALGNELAAYRRGDPPPGQFVSIAANRAMAAASSSPPAGGDEDTRLRDGLAAAWTALTGGDHAGAERILEAVLAGADVPAGGEGDDERAGLDPAQVARGDGPPRVFEVEVCSTCQRETCHSKHFAARCQNDPTYWVRAREIVPGYAAPSVSSVEEGRLGRHIERASERVRSSAAYEAIHGEGRDAPAREEEWQILCADGTVYGWYPTCPPAELVAWVNATYRKWAPVRVRRRERTVTAWVDVPACEDGGDDAR